MTQSEVIGQGILLPTNVAPPELPPDFETKKRISASSLIATIAEYEDLPSDFTTEQDLERVSPQNIDTGLVVGSREALELYDKYKIQSVYNGVGFSAVHYTMLNRSPRDLAKSSLSSFVKINSLRPLEKKLDVDEAQEVAHRFAGHALESLIVKQGTLITDLQTHITTLRAFRKALFGGGRAWYSGKNLDRIRKASDLIINTDLEIAYLNRTWADQEVPIDDLRRALQYNLYGRKGHSNTRLTIWKQYVTMAGFQANRQIGVAKNALGRTRRELEHYQPYLEHDREK